MGKHICYFYGSQNDMAALVIPFFEEGLLNNEFCLWIVPESSWVGPMKAALKQRLKDWDLYMQKGQLEIIDCGNWYTKDGMCDPDELVRNMLAKAEEALKKGFTSFRVSGDVSWARDVDWQKIVDYEEKLNEALAGKGIAVLCTYPLAKFDVTKAIVLAGHHSHALSCKDSRFDIIKGP